MGRFRERGATWGLRAWDLMKIPGQRLKTSPAPKKKRKKVKRK